MTIHASDPFATPDDQRSPVRRLRGRLPAPVTLWTAGAGATRAGLTVSSALIVDGDPGRVVGVIDDESELWTAIDAYPAGSPVTLLHPGDHLLADRFAGMLPAPGGLFPDGQWRDTPYGPVPEAAPTWAGRRLDGSRSFGWGMLVEATLEDILRCDGRRTRLLRGRYQRDRR